MSQHRCHRRIDTARKPADDAGGDRLLAYVGYLCGAEAGHCPVAAKAADVAHEIRDKLCPVGRVHHFGMELHAIEMAAFIGDCGIGRALRPGDDAKTGRQRLHPVTMAHPRSEERRVGKEWVRTWRSRWAPYP